jgi:hypothetical protein
MSAVALDIVIQVIAHDEDNIGALSDGCLRRDGQA